MTSCVFLLFLIVSLGSSIAAVDQTGLIVRITHHITGILTEAGVAFVGKLVNQTFKDFQVDTFLFKGSIRRLKFRNLTVTTDQVSFTFQKDSGVQFEIKDLHFDVEYFDFVVLDNQKITFQGQITRAKIEMKLKRERGHLAVHVPACEVKADNIRVDTVGTVGTIANFDLARQVMKLVFNSQICGAIQKYGIPELNKKLADATAVMKPLRDNDLTIDMSLSGDVVVTSSSLDVPFKGVVSLVNGAAPAGLRGTDPVFTRRESSYMAYVGASEVFFNSATQSLYRAGALKNTKQITNFYASIPLKVLQLVMQPSQLLKPLSGEVEVTELPSISITQREGVTVKIKVSGRVSPPPPASALISVSVTAMCNVADFQVSVEGHAVRFNPQTVRCTVENGSRIRDTLKNMLLGFLTNKAKQYLSALFLPLPDGLGFTVADISYNDGFLVVGGSLFLGPDVKEKLVDVLFQPISRKMFID